MRRKVHLHILFYEESNLVLREITVQVGILKRLRIFSLQWVRCN